MEGEFIFLLTNIIILVLIILLGLLMPDLARKDIVFGVKIPDEHGAKDIIKQIKKRYRINYLISSGICLVIISLMTFKGSRIDILVYGVIAQVVIEFINYYSSYKKVKKLKRLEGWTEDKKEVVIVDTEFRGKRNRRILVSPDWFLIPIMVIMINVIAGFLVYDKLPGKIPVRWDFAGNVTGYEYKSVKFILHQPVIQLFLTGTMFFCYKTIGWSKQQLDPQKVDISREQNRIFRLRWSAFMVSMCIIMVIMFTVIQFSLLGILHFPQATLSLVVVIPVILIISSMIILSIITGQGGSRVKARDVKKTDSIINRDDDKYWKLGNIYFNPKDPALFLEKRFGVGWTINFGRSGAILIFVGIILIFAVVIPIIASI